MAVFLQGNHPGEADETVDHDRGGDVAAEYLAPTRLPLPLRPADAAVATQGLFLIAWLVKIGLLTLTTLWLPAAFTLLFVLIDIALALVLYGTVGGSTVATTAGGYVTFAFTAVGMYLFVGALASATGGNPLPLGRPVLN